MVLTPLNLQLTATLVERLSKWGWNGPNIASHILTLLFRIIGLLPEAWEADTDNEEQVGSPPEPQHIATNQSVDAEQRGETGHEDFKIQMENYADVFDLEPSKEPGVQFERAGLSKEAGLGPDVPVDEISLPQDGDEPPQPAIESMPGQIGSEYAPMQEEPAHKDLSKDEATQVLIIPAREHKDSGILMGQEEIRKEQPETKPSIQNLAIEVDDLQESSNSGEKQGLDSALPSQTKKKGIRRRRWWGRY